MDLVQNGARRFVEIFVERWVIARAQTTQGLDRSTNRSEWVLDLVRYTARDLTPGGDPGRGVEATTGRREVLEHPIERLHELRDLARPSHAQRVRLVGRDLARFGRELRDGAPEAPRDEHGKDERHGRKRGRRDQHRAIDIGPRGVELFFVLRDDDGNASPRAIRDDTRRARDGGRRLALRRTYGDARDLERRAKSVEERNEMACSDEPDDVSFARSKAPRDGRDGGRRAEVEATDAAVKRRLELAPWTRQEVERIGTEDVALARDKRELILVERDALVRHERRPQRDALVRELTALGPRDDAIDQLARLARGGHELPVALRLPDHLCLHTVARRSHVTPEAIAPVATQLLTQREPEPRRGERGEAAEGDDETRSETHGCSRERAGEGG